MKIWIRADGQGLPAECVWTGDSCAAKSTGPDAALYHQVTENFEACFSSTVVKGEYVQRYSGCGEVPRARLPPVCHAEHRAHVPDAFTCIDIVNCSTTSASTVDGCSSIPVWLRCSQPQHLYNLQQFILSLVQQSSNTIFPRRCPECTYSTDLPGHKRVQHFRNPMLIE